jgi:hypothetical protein
MKAKLIFLASFVGGLAGIWQSVVREGPIFIKILGGIFSAFIIVCGISYLLNSKGSKRNLS